MADIAEEQIPKTEPCGDSPLRLTAVLTVVSAVSALLVAAAGVLTEEPIRAAQARAHAAQLRQVLPPDVPVPVAQAVLRPDGSTNFVYYAADGAVALEAESPHGYGGPLRLLVGFDRAGALYSFRVLEHSETPGLGAQLASPGNPLLVSARGKAAAGTNWTVAKDGGDIAALTAATISSRAACEALAQAAERLLEIREGTHE